MPEADEVARSLCHRVKNDLQTILNLLVLVQGQCGSTEEFCQAMQKRVVAVGAVYSLVSATGGRPCLQELAREVAKRSAARLGLDAPMRTSGVQQRLSMRLCSPLSLWIGEIVDNALTHGRPPDGGPRLICAVDLSHTGLTLVLADNGGGLPPGFSLDGHGGLGLRLAKALAENDLGGGMELVSVQGGVTATLRVPQDQFEKLDGGKWR